MFFKCKCQIITSSSCVPVSVEFKCKCQITLYVANRKWTIQCKKVKPIQYSITKKRSCTKTYYFWTAQSLQGLRSLQQCPDELSPRQRLLQPVLHIQCLKKKEKNSIISPTKKNHHQINVRSLWQNGTFDLAKHHLFVNGVLLIYPFQFLLPTV